MPDHPSAKQPPTPPIAPKKALSGRDFERLAKALRDNLLKRKSQARTRTVAVAAKDDDPEE
jgi:hypothetical protein